MVVFYSHFVIQLYVAISFILHDVDLSIIELGVNNTFMLELSCLLRRFSSFQHVLGFRQMLETTDIIEIGVILNKKRRRRNQHRLPGVLEHQ